MAQQATDDFVSPDPLLALQEGAKQIADFANLDQSRVHGALHRIIQAFGLGILDQPNQVTHALSSFPGSLLSEALSSMQSVSALELIENEDLMQLANRILLTNHLVQDCVPLYSLSELAEQTRLFVKYLQQDRDHLVKTGLPSKCFRECPWLYRHLAKLYDTRMAGSPYPADEFGSKNHLGKMAQRPYNWKKITRIHHITNDAADIEIESCPYGESSFLLLFRGDKYAKYAQKIETQRDKLFALKIKILSHLTKSLRCPTVKSVWPGALRIFAETLTMQEAKFFLKMDRWYMDADVLTGGAAGARRKMIPGGLTNLLEFVGHVEQELAIGVMRQTRDLLAKITGFSNDSPLAVASNHRGYPYFYFVGRPERHTLDAALDVMLSLQRPERRFWERYRLRVSKALRLCANLVD